MCLVKVLRFFRAVKVFVGCHRFTARHQNLHEYDVTYVNDLLVNNINCVVWVTLMIKQAMGGFQGQEDYWYWWWW
jgi:hypothetical protein